MQRWKLSDIKYDEIDVDVLKDNSILFYLVTTASFVERTSDIFTDNLIKFYKDEDEVVQWLSQRWEKEEVQHGISLAKYVKKVWRDFDYDSAYENFKREYLPICGSEYYQKSKGLELVSRMVVETGTSTFYRSMQRFALSIGEPVLEDLAGKISKDEASHYNSFYSFFKKINKTEKNGKLAIVLSIKDRVSKTSSEDIYIGYKNIFKLDKNRKNVVFNDSYFKEYKQEVAKLSKEYYPYDMAAKLLIQPLTSNKLVRKGATMAIKRFLSRQ